MAELRTLARPYAKAAFEYADEHKVLDKWSAFLATGAAVVQHPRVKNLLGSPSMSAAGKAAALTKVIADKAATGSENFLALLAEHKRLALIAEIAQLFELYKADKEQTVNVEVVSAFEVSSEQTDQLAEILRKKLERNVSIESSIDPELIGGMVIRAGDLVIDGSIRGKLAKLADAIHS